MIAQLLDEHLEALRRAGFVGSAPQPGPRESYVRGRLVEAGYGDRDDLVEFFSWAQYPGDSGTFDLFWETGGVLGVDAAVALGADLRAFRRQFPDDPIEAFPGPDHWIPILLMDSAELVLLDTSADGARDRSGGSIWFAFSHEANLKMFDSLADALRAATYCVMAGLWTISDDGYGIRCDRNFMPAPGDLHDPPWADQP